MIVKRRNRHARGRREFFDCGGGPDRAQHFLGGLNEGLAPPNQRALCLLKLGVDMGVAVVAVGKMFVFMF